MAKDERFPPHRVIGERKSGLVNKDAWLTITPSGPRRRELGETSTRGREGGSRLQGVIGPVVEVEQFRAEQHNLPPEPKPGLPWDPGFHGGYDDATNSEEI